MPLRVERDRPDIESWNWDDRLPDLQGGATQRQAVGWPIYASDLVDGFLDMPLEVFV